MTQKDFLNTLFSDDAFSSFLKNYQGFSGNVQPLLEMQRKNFQAINETQKDVIETAQAISAHQKALFSKMVAQSSEFANDLIKEGKPEEKLARNAAVLQRSYEETLASAKEVSDLVRKANHRTSSLFQKRALDSIKDIKSCLSAADAEDTSKTA